ncbi:NKCC1 [Mytilus edulis]|uniref:SLC12A2 n=1 Tax=Mytilus edulis TaxID=6550 RepID=A0A8S3RYR6_MYTED|nr:NKCC1 [Mytilus edulis]
MKFLSGHQPEYLEEIKVDIKTTTTATPERLQNNNYSNTKNAYKTTTTATQERLPTTTTSTPERLQNNTYSNYITPTKQQLQQHQNAYKTKRCRPANPQKDIPKGTILAILISSVVYIVVAWILGATVIREIPLTVCSSVLVNNTLNSNLVTSDNITSTIANCTVDPTSLFGLLHDYQVRFLKVGQPHRIMSLCICSA